MVAKAATLNLSVEQYPTKKQKAEGISSRKKSPKKAKGNHAEDVIPSARPQAVTLSAKPSRGRTSISRSSSGTGSNEPVSTGRKKNEVIDGEVTASRERPWLWNKKNADYKGAPTMRQTPAGSPSKQSKQLGKPVSTKTALRGRGCGEKVANAAETQSKSKEDAIGDFLGYL